LPRHGLQDASIYWYRRHDQYAWYAWLSWLSTKNAILEKARYERLRKGWSKTRMVPEEFDGLEVRPIDTPRNLVIESGAASEIAISENEMQAQRSCREPQTQQQGRGVERASSILYAFSATQATLTLADLASAAGLDRATTLRYARGLVQTRLLDVTSDGRYSLGFGVLELAHTKLSQLNVRTVALPVMRRIRDETGQTVMLSVRNGDSRVYIEQVEGLGEFRRVGGIGRTLPLHVGGVGLVLLAFLPEAEIERYLSSVVLERFSDTTITDKAELRRALEGVRRDGYSISENVRGQGGGSVAAPIFDHGAQVVAALNVSAPVENLRSIRDLARRLVVSGAAEISDLLGLGQVRT
jgi:IclR family transcriptional regulator, KDG regulon repressor